MNKIKVITLLLFLITIPISFAFIFNYIMVGYECLINEINNIQYHIDYKAPKRFTLEGRASWYDYELPSGWSSKGHFVCATRDFERYSFVKVINLKNGKSIKCKITDYVENPNVIIDLSSASFDAISDLKLGIISVKVEQL